MSTIDRRVFRRWEMPCLISLFDDGGRMLARTRTVNISDGGAYVMVPVENLPEGSLPHKLNVHLSVPRSTPNTYLLEDFRTWATVRRAEPLEREDCAGLAISWIEPIHLELQS